MFSTIFRGSKLLPVCLLLSTISSTQCGTISEVPSYDVRRCDFKIHCQSAFQELDGSAVAEFVDFVKQGNGDFWSEFFRREGTLRPEVFGVQLSPKEIIHFCKLVSLTELRARLSRLMRGGCAAVAAAVTLAVSGGALKVCRDRQLLGQPVDLRLKRGAVAGCALVAGGVLWVLVSGALQRWLRDFSVWKGTAVWDVPQLKPVIARMLAQRDGDSSSSTDIENYSICYCPSLDMAVARQMHKSVQQRRCALCASTHGEHEALMIPLVQNASGKVYILVPYFCCGG